jgi:hypothetical protein
VKVRHRKILWGALLVLWWYGGPTGVDGQALELLKLPRNAALVPPAGQGLDLIHSAEPLGKGRFRFRSTNRSQSITLPEVGNGSVYTGVYGMAYGISPTLEASLVVPLLMDAAGGLNKYGTSDPVVGIKLSRSAKIPASFYTAYQVLIGLPLGYKGEHALDKVGGVRAFSTESVDLGLQFLLDMHFQHLSVYLNGGYFRSGNVDILPELVYGAGLELGRYNRFISANAEYWTRVAFSAESRAAAAFKMGVRINLFRGVELELNREFGFLDHPSKAIFTFGFRMHGYLTGRRRLEPRYVLYKPTAPPRRLYQPSAVLRVAIVDFEGFEDFDAGERLVEKIKTRLEPHDSLEVVDLKRYEDIPHKGYLKPREAIDLARKLGVDVVVTGKVSQYEIDRYAGYQVPFLVKLPESKVKLELRYRIMEFYSPDKTDMQAHIEQVEGQSRLHKRVRLLPSDRTDVTVNHSAGELNEAQDRAMNDLVGKMLASMATKFTWVPPDFLP